MSVQTDGGMRLELDFKHPDNVRNPFPLYRWLRERDPVHWSESLRSWAILRYDHVLEVLQSHERFSSDRFSPLRSSAGDAPERTAVKDVASVLRLWMGLCDPPDHTRRRKPWHQSFTPKALAEMRPKVQAIVDGLLDRVADRGEMEFIDDFAFPLPTSVIGLTMNLPPEDTEKVKVWSDLIGHYMGGATTDDDNMERAQEGVISMADYFREVVAQRRSQPQDDMIGLMLRAEAEGSLTEDEVVANCVLLVFAGHETTTHLLGNGLYHLLRDREQYELLANDGELAKNAVEEFLRFDGAVPAVPRVATEDCELGGVRIAAGDRLVVFLSSANRDPERFPDPERLDVRREIEQHLAFAQGIHFCLGANLARLEGQITFETLFRRFKDFRLLDEDPPWLPQIFLRGVERLPVAFRKR